MAAIKPGFQFFLQDITDACNNNKKAFAFEGFLEEYAQCIFYKVSERETFIKTLYLIL